MDPPIIDLSQLGRLAKYPQESFPQETQHVGVALTQQAHVAGTSQQEILQTTSHQRSTVPRRGIESETIENIGSYASMRSHGGGDGDGDNAKTTMEEDLMKEIEKDHP